MLMYKVIKFFTDAKDHGHAYKPGDEYPREGLVVSKNRLEELASSNNKRGIPLIEEVVEEKPAVVEAEMEKPEEIITEEKPKPEKPKRGRKAKGKE